VVHTFLRFFFFVPLCFLSSLRLSYLSELFTRFFLFHPFFWYVQLAFTVVFWKSQKSCTIKTTERRGSIWLLHTRSNVLREVLKKMRKLTYFLTFYTFLYGNPVIWKNNFAYSFDTR
jgi:hypothetical protein